MKRSVRGLGSEDKELVRGRGRDGQMWAGRGREWSRGGDEGQGRGAQAEGIPLTRRLISLIF